MAAFNLNSTTFLIFSVLSIVHVLSSRQEDPRQVQIPQGLLQGKELRSREGKTFYGFIGIPYAQKPGLFEPAVYPPLNWGGTYDASDYGPLCMQMNRTTGIVEGDEDCLWINIFTPNPKGNLSVLAFIHGGGFRNTWHPENGPEYLLDHHIVFVTFSYRLAKLGFLSTGDEFLPGNLGLKDQNLALRWIQDNIGYFGGDKNRVTISGESAGSASVSHHVLSPLRAGLFRHAICQSGSSLDRWAVVENPKLLAMEVAKNLDCPTSSSELLVACLKTKPAEEIVKAEFTTSIYGTGVAFGPVIEPMSAPEPRFLTEQPVKIYQEGRFNKVPLIITVNEMEGLTLSALRVLTNPQAVDRMNAEWDSVAQEAFLINKSSYSNESKLWATTKIREYYFGSKLVGNDTLLNLANAYTDATFSHRERETALMHAKHAPVYITMLGFKGIWSHSFEYGFSQVIGMTHADDLQYLFRNFRYPIFPPGSEFEGFSKLLTGLWVDYANTGTPHYNLNGREWAPVTDEEISLGRITWLVLKKQPEFVEEPLQERMLLWNEIEQVLETGEIP